MDNIKRQRLISYLRLKSLYFELLCNKEIELDCLYSNYDLAKEKSDSYFIDGNHNDENIEICIEEMKALKYCVYNVRQCKNLDIELNETKLKLIKAKKKLNQKI